VILRQAPDQLAAATAAFGLSETETQIVGQLSRGRALWKIGSRTALVHHLVTSAEATICDTDQRMRPNPGGFGITEGSGGSNPSVDGIG
jgi:hypothetical protein